MSFRDYERLDIEKLLKKYGNITLIDLLKIMESEKDDSPD